MSGSVPPSLSVLVADDSPEMRSMLSRYLEANGYQVTAVETGDDAIRVLKTRYFDLIVTDMLMPGADGIEVMAEIRKRYPSTRIIAITGGGNALDPNLCVRIAKGLGAHATLLKPFSIPQFAAALGRAVSSQVTT
jgi:CheY-like chemotaxis protein